jgi:hypothetical protein
LSCTPSNVTQYAAASSGVRVVVVSLGYDTPVVGATVMAEDGTTQTTGTDGSVVFTSLTGSTHTISVFDTNYAYVTVMNTTATDMLIPMKPVMTPGSFSGTLAASDFNNVSNELGTLHLDISGASIGGNLIDLSLSTLLGPSQSVTISLGTATSYGPFNLPEGIALGLGPTMFGPGPNGGQYGIDAVPGYRALWSLGGNAVIGDVLQIIGPFLSGGTSGLSSDIPQILTAVLPLIGTLESGVTSGVAVTSNSSETLTYGTTPQPALELDTLMRLHLNANPPALESYTDDSGNTVPFDGAVVLSGVLDSPQGFVPLGVTAGVATASTSTPTTPGTLSAMPLRMAPRHGGVETAPWAYITLGASLSSLVSGLGSSSSGSTGTVLSGTVVFSPTVLKYNGGATTDVDLSHPFLPIPTGAAFNPAATSSTATFTPPSPVTGATFHRLDIGSAPNQWSIYFPASLDSATATPVTIPTPPSGITNRATASGATAVLQSVSLGYPPPGNDAPETYDGAVQFDGVDLDDLTRETDSFAVRALPAPAQ